MQSYNKKVSFHTLGCKLNFSETSTLARQFEAGGFVRAAAGDVPDICIVNTCSVTGQADKKCRNLIRRLAGKYPHAIIAVTGCYAQLKAGEIAGIEGVDIVVGNQGKSEMFRKVSALTAKKGGAEVHGCGAGEITSFFASFSSGDRTRAFLKVQDGCDYKCSYCTIPYARGASRNIPIDEVVRQAEKISASGIKEIVLTGINTGDFGKTTGENFLDLLGALAGIDGIERYRISSIEPNLLTDRIIAYCAGNPKFMPHFHIPLQSGSDRVLGAMRRRYRTADFAERIEKIRELIPDAFIGIDVITGFPGETRQDFDRSYSFLETLEPAFIHVFPYSEREGTPAVALPGKVSAKDKTERTALLTRLGDLLHYRFASRMEGRRVEVLFESDVKNGHIRGFTPNYVKVKIPYDRQAINNIRRVVITDIGPDGEATGSLL
ncbi:MAG: tRNA (N(6)-L-threonylcarbamoyladenosine(37)-C(2))-methylthiotransferase MtaB [Rikenellaceae bacterium]|nr:tRNA (N(6)-L-threonylcarbamoyladenosine(37)-C(2))-methylthiotransferase MtaB [Rikenellaceae bacterium]